MGGIVKMRWVLLVLCAGAALSVAGQTQTVPTPRQFRVNPAVLQVPTATLEPQVLKMPDLRWMTPREAAMVLRERLHLVPEFFDEGPIVIGQDPAPGEVVDPNATVAVTLGVPKLTLTASNASPLTDDEVKFTAALDPPSPEASYAFAWGDGSEDPRSVSPEATHRYSAAGTYEASVRAFIRDVEAGSASVTIAPVVPPPADDTTATTATDTTVTEMPIATTETVQPPKPAGEPPIPLPPDNPQPPPSVPWLTITLVALAMIGGGALARARWRKPSPPAVAPPPLSMRSGLGSTDHTIEQSEQITTGLNVRLRGGVRSVIAEEGGADA
jgi:PKD domain/PASTA domain